MNEAGFLALLRGLPLHPGARGLADDAAVIDPPAGRQLVLTHDAMAENVHFLPDDPPGDVAWKLVAVNLSDLAAKGAVPLGVMLGYPLGEAGWDRAFVAGLAEALAAFAVPLIGGDTVRGPRVIGLTAIGHVAPGGAPSRSGARAGDALWVTGTIGDAGLGLALLREGRCDPAEPVATYRRPVPRLAEGLALAPLARAMMDVSDGLLIDARRMAEASGVGVTIDLAAVPLSAPAIAEGGGDRAARLRAATAGDDYELLFALPAEAAPPVAATRIGAFDGGSGLRLVDGGAAVTLPDRLGWQHG